MSQNNESEGLLVSSLFMGEDERNKVFSKYLKRSGYKESGSPLFTMMMILIGETDELFEDSNYSE